MSEQLDLTNRVIEESETQDRLELSRLHRREVVEHVASEEFVALGRDPHSAHVVERACNELRSAFDASDVRRPELQAGERKTPVVAGEIEDPFRVNDLGVARQQHFAPPIKPVRVSGGRARLEEGRPHEIDRETVCSMRSVPVPGHVATYSGPAE